MSRITPVIIVLLAVGLSGCINPPTTSNKVIVLPATQSGHVGDTIVVTVKGTFQESFNGIETSLRFNPYVLQVSGIGWDTLFGDNSYTSSPRVNNATGLITEIYAVSIQNNITSNGDSFFSVYFTAVNVGHSTIELIDTSVVNTTSNLEFIVANGNITIS
jgi:hypothetical protein